jgi:methylmalonyl-CoA mutase
MESSGPPSGTDDAPSEPLAAEFPAVDAARWEAVVRAKERDPDRPLATALEEGIEVNWLYTPRDALAPDPGGAAGAEPFVRGWRVGSPWAIRQQNATTQRRQANLEILEELEGGATELLLVTAAPDRGGIPVSTVDELQEVLDGVYLDLAPVALDAGTQAAETAALLTEVWRRSTHPAVEMRGSLRLDPIGALAGSGQATRPQLADEIDAAARILSEVHAEFPQVQVLAVDTTPYVEAGAGAVLELALALSTAIAYLRAGDDIDVDPAAVAAAIEFTLVAGPDQFLEIAKLRAARRLWSHVLAQCGVAAERRRSPVYVRTSRRMVSALDPWNNLLRSTSAAFAAAVAGADGITVLPFDEPVLAADQTPSPLGRRMARNTQLVLLEEAALHQVADPAGGSWYVESLTDQLARLAWAELQQIEGAGGITVAVSSGDVARRVSAATAARHAQLAHRRRSLTGVNTFPLLGDDGLERAGAPPEADALAAIAEEVPDDPDDRRALTPVRDGAAFEALRARAARIAAERGAEPTILLACMGPLSAHAGVAQWAKSFFEAGGVTALPSGVRPDAAAQADLLTERRLTVAALCRGRDADPGEQAELVGALRAAGARVVYVAGATDEDAAAVGADLGVGDGVDMVTVLGELLDRFEDEYEDEDR